MGNKFMGIFLTFLTLIAYIFFNYTNQKQQHNISEIN